MADETFALMAGFDEPAADLAALFEPVKDASISDVDSAGRFRRFQQNK